MNKELFSFLFIFIALFVGAIYYSSPIQVPLTSSLNYIKSTFHNSIKIIDMTIYKHTFQANHIEELQEKLVKYENNHLVMKQLAHEINDLFIENNSSLKSNPKVKLVRAISYEKFGNLNRIWLDINKYDSSKIYGLVYNEYVAGIVIPKHNKPLALLNRDIKSSYAVYVGEGMAPGIAHGNNSQNVVVKFIPAWFNIKIGDDVITSGLDEIFFKGLKVGKVISITKAQGYQNAVIQQYYKSHELNYFHLITSLK